MPLPAPINTLAKVRLFKGLPPNSFCGEKKAEHKGSCTILTLQLACFKPAEKYPLQFQNVRRAEHQFKAPL